MKNPTPQQVKKRYMIAAVQGTDGVLGERPLFQINLGKAEAAQLSGHLRTSASTTARRRYTVTATFHEPNRLRLTWTSVPQYEANACEDYVRGDALVVTGTVQSSANLDMSSSGALELAEKIDRAAARCQHFIRVVVPSRAHNLVELVADTELALDLPDAGGIGATGASLAAEVWEAEDFSDWERK